MSRPLVSIVLPVFNRLGYVRVALASVYAQTFENWELIIIDDGSDEETRQFLEKQADSRTKVLFREHSGVPAVVRNVGIARACGKYVAFLDSDDVWAADKLQVQLTLMETAPTRQWSYTAVRKIDADGRVLDDAQFEPWAGYSGSVVEELLRFEASVAMPTVIAELALVRDVGGFDETMKFAEDYDLWLRLAMRSEVSVTSKPLADVRSHPQRFSADSIGGLEGWQRLFEKMQELMPIPDLRRLCRRRAGEQALLLAAHHARASRWTSMQRSLLTAARARVWSLPGWLRVGKAAVSSRRRDR
ncbi:MAG: glycosyltransferase [Gammaproteobacteria bacterium]|nr:glycosyltransferase [Gammaproteobacteria bacterium]MDH3578615.1 glycosyltransferase [Gammaproteobacteria bacterium]